MNELNAVEILLQDFIIHEKDEYIPVGIVLTLMYTDSEGPCRVTGSTQQLYLECLLADKLRCEETLLPGGSSVDIQLTTSSTFD